MVDMVQKPNLVRCKGCGKHYRWRFADGSYSPYFMDVVSGLVWFVRGILQKKTPADRFAWALEQLQNQGMASGDADHMTGVGITVEITTEMPTTSGHIH